MGALIARLSFGQRSQAALLGASLPPLPLPLPSPPYAEPSAARCAAAAHLIGLPAVSRGCVCAPGHPSGLPIDRRRAGRRAVRPSAGTRPPARRRRRRRARRPANWPHKPCRMSGDAAASDATRPMTGVLRSRQSGRRTRQTGRLKS